MNISTGILAHEAKTCRRILFCVCVCFLFIIVDRYGSLVHEFSYTGDDVVVRLIQNVLQCEQLLINTTKFNKYMIFTKGNRKEFEKASVCFICNNNRGIKGKQEKWACSRHVYSTVSRGVR